ncbi:helix-turn-helix domain-containing protein [Paenibacillus sp. FSL W7-1088]|uniref:helix-turn-helix domain-containing protein n=1 Tax=Paenibacillus sp. FSL W7-1088 TaxID=2921695 RepID=UPI0030EEFDF8
MERMSIKEAAPYIGASPYKLREMVREKKIPAYRIGNKIMFRKEALDKWILNQESESSSSIQ